MRFIEPATKAGFLLWRTWLEIVLGFLYPNIFAAPKKLISEIFVANSYISYYLFSCNLSPCFEIFSFCPPSPFQGWARSFFVSSPFPSLRVRSSFWSKQIFRDLFLLTQKRSVAGSPLFTAKLLNVLTADTTLQVLLLQNCYFLLDHGGFIAV